MPSPALSRWLADGVLVLHAGVVLFVVGGWILTLLGNWRGWGWVNGLRFRLTHLAAIAFVVAQAWLGATCPLTALESWLRVQAHAAAYRTSFIEHWLQRLLFYAAPPWVFMLAYSVFAAFVVAAWWWFPPRFGASRREDKVPRAV